MKTNILISVLILGSILATPQKAAGAPRLISVNGEFQQQNRAPQTDPELNVEAIKQQLHLLPRQQRQQLTQSFVKKLPMNNEADIEPLYQYSPLRLLTRFQRSTSSQQQQPYSLQMANNQQQMLLEDELALRRQLPELIAQARSDKNVERALLKMLISASLRSAPTTNLVQQPSTYQYNGRPDVWQEYAGESGSGTPTAGESVFRLPARLVQVIDDIAGVDSSVNDLGQVEQYPSAAIVDKREYTKPCSFNAISCPKPFREPKT